MKTVNIHEAKTHLSRLLRRVAKGEEIIIARAGKPLARLVPAAGARSIDDVLGVALGQVRLAEDLTAPLPHEVLEAFESKTR